MGITLTIVGGLVLMTIAAAGFDYLGRRAKASPADAARTRELERRLEALETRVQDRDERVAKLEGELAFVNRLLEDRSGGKGVAE
ncbi:MAG: hypothetical protein JXA15_09765 [Spirochaetales bacterium]|nr:hypothetical protein [Spirochaetales bacterium]